MERIHTRNCERIWVAKRCLESLSSLYKTLINSYSVSIRSPLVFPLVVDFRLVYRSRCITLQLARQGQEPVILGTQNNGLSRKAPPLLHPFSNYALEECGCAKCGRDRQQARVMYRRGRRADSIVVRQQGSLSLMLGTFLLFSSSRLARQTSLRFCSIRRRAKAT